MTNIILATDSYKFSHFLQYPPETRRISAYIEARKNDFADQVLFFGLQAFLLDHLARPIVADDIGEAEDIAAMHGVPFNRAGWEMIVADHDGFLPIEIKALAEGMIAPTGIPLVQVENTDERMPWLTTYIETALLRAIWYPTSVATVSALAKRIIHAGLVETSDDPMGQLPFKLHDFGARGVSSGESASLGGLAHLVNFKGTDTLEAILAARRFYAEPMAGFSIPAAEHSTITSWGRAREAEAYANMLSRFKQDGRLVAVVSDSYDLDHAIADIWGDEIKAQVLSTGGTLVIRPDSGDPITTPIRALETLWAKFGGRVNDKGYRVLSPHVRVIQGDGMTLQSIGQLVGKVAAAGFSLDNIAFGMGGGLLQHVTRDTLSFAMKANAMQDRDGVWHSVAKTPATDARKTSKAGRQAVIERDGEMIAVLQDAISPAADLMRPVWRNGTLLVRDTFAAIRARSEAGLLSCP